MNAHQTDSLNWAIKTHQRTAKEIWHRAYRIERLTANGYTDHMDRIVIKNPRTGDDCILQIGEPVIPSAILYMAFDALEKRNITRTATTNTVANAQQHRAMGDAFMDFFGEKMSAKAALISQRGFKWWLNV